MEYKLLMFIKEEECEVHEPYQKENGRWEIDLLLYPHQIKEFCDILGTDFLCEGGIEATLMDGYIGVNLYDILESLGMEHEEIIKECEKLVR